MPAESGAQADIPVIDINSSSPDVAQRLLDAASTYGFVFVANKHEPDIDHADVDRMFQHVKIHIFSLSSTYQRSNPF